MFFFVMLLAPWVITYKYFLILENDVLVLKEFVLKETQSLVSENEVQVHKEWYRQEPSTVELTKVARVFLAKDEVQNLQNKKVSFDLEG